MGSLLLLLAVLLVVVIAPWSAPDAGDTGEMPAPATSIVAVAAPVEGPQAESIVTLVDVTNQERWERSLRGFEEQTGINIIPSEVDDLEVYIASTAGTPRQPDIVAVPQPGFLFQLARQGLVVDVSTVIDDARLRDSFDTSLLEAATADDMLLGIWKGLKVKSLVWYPKQAFDEAGYEVPESWAELLALSDEIAADGRTPWCIGVENGEATGWMGTDWIEDILLRTAPPESYDAWTRGELPFSSPEVRRAFELLELIWFNDDYVYGGTASILERSVLTNPDPLFEDPPGCFLLRMGNWVPVLFPEEAVYGQDYDFFPLPPIEPAYGLPLLGGGDIMAMLNDRPEVRAAMNYLTTAESARVHIEDGVMLPAHRDVPAEWYTSPLPEKIAAIRSDASAFRFDGSDLMPIEVGTAFWQGIVDWLEGEELDSVLQRIDASWPAEP